MNLARPVNGRTNPPTIIASLTSPALRRTRDFSRTNFECPPTTLLSAEVGRGRQRDAGWRPLRRLGRRDRGVAEEVADGLGEMPNVDRLDTRERGLLRRVHGAQHPREPGTCGALRGRDRAGYRPNATVEAESSPMQACSSSWLARDLRRRGEHGQRDRQVESRPLLAERGRREVDGDRPVGPLEER